MENGVGAWAPHAAASVHSSKRAGTRAPFLRQGVLALLAPRAAEIAALLEDRWRGFYEGYAHKRPSRAGGGRKASCGVPPPQKPSSKATNARAKVTFSSAAHARRACPLGGAERAGGPFTAYVDTPLARALLTTPLTSSYLCAMLALASPAARSAVARRPSRRSLSCGSSASRTKARGRSS